MPQSCPTLHSFLSSLVFPLHLFDHLFRQFLASIFAFVPSCFSHSLCFHTLSLLLLFLSLSQSHLSIPLFSLPLLPVCCHPSILLSPASLPLFLLSLTRGETLYFSSWSHFYVNESPCEITQAAKASDTHSDEHTHTHTDRKLVGW